MHDELEVASLVTEATNGSDPNLVIAALLHDAIEDQEVPLINYTEWAPYEAEIAQTFLETMRKADAPRSRTGQAAAS